MTHTTLALMLTALLIGGCGGYAIAERNTDSQALIQDNTRIVPQGMHRMHDGTLMGNGTTRTNMAPMHHGMMMVESERAFLTEMIPHHEEAVQTARQVLARGATTPDMKTLAENIVTAQEREIADMKAWYEAWYGTPYVSSGTYVPMMRTLDSLTGKDLDRAFLDDMVMHHMGAIMMAESVQRYIEHEEIRNLTKAIIKTQSEEIEIMRRLRAQL